MFMYIISKEINYALLVVVDTAGDFFKKRGCFYNTYCGILPVNIEGIKALLSKRQLIKHTPPPLLLHSLKSRTQF